MLTQRFSQSCWHGRVIRPRGDPSGRLSLQGVRRALGLVGPVLVLLLLDSLVSQATICLKTVTYFELGILVLRVLLVEGELILFNRSDAVVEVVLHQSEVVQHSLVVLALLGTDRVALQHVEFELEVVALLVDLRLPGLSLVRRLAIFHRASE